MFGEYAFEAVLHEIRCKAVCDEITLKAGQMAYLV